MIIGVINGRGSSGSAAEAASPGAKPHRARQGYAGGIDLSREGVFVAIVGQGRSLSTALGTLPIFTYTVISFWKGLSAGRSLIKYHTKPSVVQESLSPRSFSS